MDDPRRIRIEVEVKPGKREGKQTLSMLDDAALFGCAGWSKEFLERAGILGIDRVRVGSVWKPSDEQRVIAAMVKQYGGLLESILDRAGAHGLERIIRDQRRCDQQIRATLQALQIDAEAEQW